jgi:hypothetical protein
MLALRLGCTSGAGCAYADGLKKLEGGHAEVCHNTQAPVTTFSSMAAWLIQSVGALVHRAEAKGRKANPLPESAPEAYPEEENVSLPLPAASAGRRATIPSTSSSGISNAGQL